MSRDTALCRQLISKVNEIVQTRALEAEIVQRLVLKMTKMIAYVKIVKIVIGASFYWDVAVTKPTLDLIDSRVIFHGIAVVLNFC